jgi:hypothetical protein
MSLLLGSFFISSVVFKKHIAKFTYGLSKKLRDINSPENIGVIPSFATVLLLIVVIVVNDFLIVEDFVICLNKELVLQVMSGQVIIAFAYPVVEDFDVRLQAE